MFCIAGPVLLRQSGTFTEICSGSEAGSHLRLINCVYHSTLGLRVIKKKKHLRGEVDVLVLRKAVSRDQAPPQRLSLVCKQPSIPSIPCKQPYIPVNSHLFQPSIPCKQPSIPCKQPSFPCKQPSIPCKQPSIPGKPWRRGGCVCVPEGGRS